MWDWNVGIPSACTMLELMNHGGKIALLGIHNQNTVIDWNQVIFKGLEIKGIWSRNVRDLYKMVAMSERSRFVARYYASFHVDEYETAFATYIRQ
jgi:threonine 3-dehydrogenase